MSAKKASTYLSPEKTLVSRNIMVCLILRTVLYQVPFSRKPEKFKIQKMFDF
jgi:hypothetical protein